MGNFKNSIMLGIELDKLSDVQGRLDKLIKSLNNNKIVLDIQLKDNTILKTLENLGKNTNLGNIENALKKVTKEAEKLSAELNNISNANLNKVDNNLDSINSSLKESSSSSSGFFSGMGDFLKKAGLLVTIDQAISRTVSGVKEGISTVIDMDTALGNLNKVVNLSSSQLLEMRDSAVEMGKELGRSSIEVANAQAEFGRLYKTQDEINSMTKVSIMGANVMDGQTPDQVAKSLTTIITSMKLEAKDSMTILDSMNEIQNNYRVSASTLSEALAHVGSTAYTSGAKLQEVEGYITAIATATGKEGSEIGNSLKSMMARLFTIGSEGIEAAGKPEKMLNEMGVAVRDAEGNFRNFSTILQDLSVKWVDMSDTQKIATSQVVAGINRYDDFMALLNNYSSAVDSTTTALNSQGSAEKENAIHMQTAEAKLGTLKATTEELAYTMINSDSVKYFIDELTQLVSSLSQVDGKTIAFIASVGTVSLALSKLSKINKAIALGETVTGLSKFIGLASGMNVVGSKVTGVTSAFKLLTTGIKGSVTASLALIATPLGLTIAGIASVVGIATAIFVQYKHEQAEVTGHANNLKSAIDSVNSAIASGDINTATENLKKAQDEEKKLIALIEARKQADGKGYEGEMIADRKIQLQIKALEDLGYTVDTTTGKIEELSSTQSALDNATVVDGIKNQTKAQLENRENLEGAKSEYDNYISTVKNLYGEYQTLSAQENLSSADKSKLGDVVNQLQDKFGDLNVSIDENGKVHISNNGLIQDSISYLESEGLSINSLSSIRISDAKVTSEWQVGNSTVTYSEISNRIGMYKSEIEAIRQVAEAKNAYLEQPLTDSIRMNGVAETATRGGKSAYASLIDNELGNDKEYIETQSKIKELENAKKKIDSIYNSVKPPVNNTGTVKDNSSNYMPSEAGGDSKKSSSADTAEKEEETALKEAVERDKALLQEISDAYDDTKTKVSDSLKDIELNEQLLGDADNSNYVDRVKLANDRIVEQSKALDSANQQLMALENTTVETDKGQQSLTESLSKATTEIKTQKLEVIKLQKSLSDLAKDQIKELIEKEKELKDLELEAKQNKETKDLKDYSDAMELDHENKINDLNEEMDALEKQKDIEDQEVKIAELKADIEEKKADLIEKQNDLKQKQIDLERAQNQKTIYQYKQDEKGDWNFEWVADNDAVNSAKDNVNSAQTDVDSSTSSVSDSKKALSDYYDELEYNASKQAIQDKIDEEDAKYKVVQQYLSDTSDALKAQQDIEKKQLENHYKDIDKLSKDYLSGLNQQYGDNWSGIATTIDTNLTTIEERFNKLNDLNVNYGLDSVAEGMNSSNLDTYIEQRKNTIKGEVDVTAKALNQQLADLVSYSSEMEKKKTESTTNLYDTQKAYSDNSTKLQNDTNATKLLNQLEYLQSQNQLTEGMLNTLHLIYDEAWGDIVDVTTLSTEEMLKQLQIMKGIHDKYVEMWNDMNEDDQKDKVSISDNIAELGNYKDNSIKDYISAKELLYGTGSNSLSQVGKLDTTGLSSISLNNGLNTLMPSTTNNSTSTNNYYTISDVSVNADDANNFLSSVLSLAKQSAKTSK